MPLPSSVFGMYTLMLIGTGVGTFVAPSAGYVISACVPVAGQMSASMLGGAASNVTVDDAEVGGSCEGPKYSEQPPSATTSTKRAISPLISHLRSPTRDRSRYRNRVMTSRATRRDPSSETW